MQLNGIVLIQKNALKQANTHNTANTTDKYHYSQQKIIFYIIYSQRI
mgnify:CR=1